MRKIDLAVFLLLCAVRERPFTHVSAQEPASDGIVEQFRIAKEGDLILLPVHVGDNNYPFILDGGATHHVFDVSLRAHLGDTIGKGATHDPALSKLESPMVPTPNVRVGRFTLGRRDRSVVLDLANVRRGTGEDIRGVLDSPFFEGRLIEIDFDLGLLTVRARRDDTPYTGCTERLRIDSEGGQWIDNVRIGERVESFRLATAVTSSVQVHKWLFESLVADGQLQSKGTLAFNTPAGPVYRRWGRLARLSLGDDQHVDLAAREGDVNLIGLGLLARYVVTFDVSGERIHLRRGRDFDRPDQRNETGLHLDQIAGAFEVTAVDKDSPADQAGLKLRDHVTRVNGRPCQEMRLLEVMRILRESSGKMLNIEVSRDAKVFSATLDVVE